MDLDNMQDIWQNQQAENAFNMDVAAIEEHIHQRKRSVLKAVNFVEWGLFTVTFGLAVNAVMDTLSSGQWYQLVDILLFLSIATWIALDRKKRRLTGGQSNQSILGDLQVSIHSLHYQIHRQKRIIWWFLLPIAIVAGVHMVFEFADKSIWKWLAVPVSLCGMYWLAHYEVRCKLQPQLEKLIALRQLLIEQPPQD